MTRTEIKLAKLNLVLAASQATMLKAKCDMTLSQQRLDNATLRHAEASNEITRLQAKLDSETNNVVAING